MVEGALYPIPVLNGTLAGGVRTVIVSPEGEAFLTEPQKEYLKSLILMPGDPLTITCDLDFIDEHYGYRAEIDNEATTINQGDSYTATVTAKDNRRWLDVTVLMGGINITDSMVEKTSFNTAVISIPNVTGNLKITARTEEYVRGLTARYDKTAARKANFVIYEDTDLDNLKPYTNVYLSAKRGDTTETIETTDYTIEGDLTLPSRYDGADRGTVTVTAHWNEARSIQKTFSVEVYRRTT